MIDPTNDTVTIYQDAEALWRWRRVDGDNGRIVSMSSEGYVSQKYATEAAAAYNSDLDEGTMG